MLFYSQDSMNCDVEEETFSPARKKWKTSQDSSTHLERSDTGKTQDSSENSQMSQDFADRMSHMRVQCSQDGSSNFSHDGLSFPKPNNRGKSSLSLFDKCIAHESERQVDVLPSELNKFQIPADCSASAYIEERHVLQTTVPTKIWISAFKERSRYLTEFEELFVLGCGTFSSVYCTRHRLEGTLYAIKKLKQKLISLQHKKLALKELQALSSLRQCPNIIQYFGCWIDGESSLYIQQELCCLGCLEDLVSTRPSFLSEMNFLSVIQYQQTLERNRAASYVSEESIPGLSQARNDATAPFRQLPQLTLGISEDLAWFLVAEVSATLRYLHERGVVHLDIRPSNLLLRFADSFTYSAEHPLYQFPRARFEQMGDAEVLQLKETVRRWIEACIVSRQYLLRVADFGHCHRLHSDLRNIEEGETRYCAPEFISSVSLQQVDFTKCDVFSLGIAVYELCLGRLLGIHDPEDAATGSSEWHRIRNGQLDAGFLSRYSPPLVECLSSMMHADPTRRPSAQQLIAAAAATSMNKENMSASSSNALYGWSFGDK